MHGVECVDDYGAARRCGGNLIHAIKPADFFDQIRFALEIYAKSGDAKGWRRGVDALKSQTLEELALRVRRDVHSEQFVGFFATQTDLLGLRRRGISVYGWVQQAAARDFEDELGGAAAGP